ncbi:MAG: hypothetical protein LBQ66_08085 [Planctomycetaceae bacterium]|nr:hypothetical protein [Planctomycetaceae bacterium]
MKELRDIDEGTIRRIDWQELLPPVLLFRIFNTSVNFRVLCFAIVGLLLTIAADMLFLNTNTTTKQHITQKTDDTKNIPPMLQHIHSTLNPNAKTDLSTKRQQAAKSLPQNKNTPNTTHTKNITPPNQNSQQNFLSKNFNKFQQQPTEFILGELRSSVFFPWIFFTSVGERYFMGGGVGWYSFGVGLFYFLLVLVVWCLFGGLICRVVALRLASDRSDSVRELFRFLWERGGGFFSSVLLLVVGVFVCTFPIRIFDFFSGGMTGVAASIFFPVAMLFNYFALVLLFGLWLGFPLLFAAVAVEGTDGFDAISRLMSYLYQRPFHYFVYWFFAIVIGFLGYIFVSVFIAGTIYLTEQFSGMTVGLSLFNVAQNTAAESCCSGANSFNVMLVSAWLDLVRLLVVGYVFAWFWTSGTAIYFLLRRSVDAAPFTDVYIQDKKPARILKPLKVEEESKNS